MSAICGIVAAAGWHIHIPAVQEQLLDQPTLRSECSIIASTSRAIFASSRAAHSGDIFAGEGLLVLCDCRLDNEGDLCRLFGLQQSQTTTAQLLALAYRRWGASAPAHLDGEFAFGIWDQRTEVLFCARDRFGVRPLHYRLANGGFLFGTKASLAAVDVGLANLDVNQAWLTDHLNGIVASDTQTAYRLIQRLPPGSWLQWTSAGVRTGQYWTFQDVGPVDTGLKSEDLTEALRDAVVKRLPAGPATAFLSGGLDSSSICCLAQSGLKSRGSPPLRTISLTFGDTPKEDERAFVDAVLRHGDFCPSFVAGSDQRPLRELPRLIGIQEAPFLAPGLPISELAYAKLREFGLPVALDGHGGDEVISSGIGYLVDIARAQNWPLLASQAALLSVHQRSNPLTTFTALHGIYGKGITAKVARKAGNLMQARASKVAFPVLAEHLRSDPAAGTRLQEYSDFHPVRYQNDRHAHIATLSAPLQSHVFELLNNVCLAHNVECRYPFWDRRVVEICLRMPAKSKLSNGRTRGLLREAMKGVLPEKVRRRMSKLDFSGHAIRGILRDRSMLIEIVEDGSTDMDQFIDRAAYRAAAAGMVDNDGSIRRLANIAVWKATTLAIWLQSRRAETKQRQRPVFVRELSG